MAISVAGLAAFGDPRFTLPLDLSTVGYFAIVTLFPLMGGLIIQRRPYTRVAWLMIALGLGLGLGLLTYAYGVNGMPPAPPSPFALELLALSQLFFVPSLGGATILHPPPVPDRSPAIAALAFRRLRRRCGRGDRRRELAVAAR